ncbi:MAG: tetratricopeptide repeat protein, partial [Myxococcota bacterium]
GERVKACEACFGAADLALTQAMFDQAAVLTRRGLELLDEEDPRAVGRRVVLARDILLPLGERAQALELLDHAQQLADDGTMPFMQVIAAKGLVLVGTDRSDDGFVYARTAEAYFEAHGAPCEQIACLGAMCIYLRAQERPDEAYESADKAVGVAHTLNDPIVLGRALRLRGMARIRQRLAESALADLEEARRLFQDANAPYLEARVLDAIGINLINIGDYRQAKHHFTDALALVGHLNLGDFAVGLRVNLAGCWAAGLGEFKRAVELQRQARQMAMEVGNTYLAHRILPNMVDCLTMLNAHEQAIALGLEALDYALRVDDEQLAFRLRVVLASCTYQLGHLDKAWHWAQQAEPFSPGNALRQAYTYSLFGHIALEQGRIEVASQHLEQALAVARHEGYKQIEADTVMHMARVHRYTGRLDDAVVCLEQARASTSMSGNAFNALLVSCEASFVELARDPGSGPHGPELDAFAERIDMGDQLLFKRERQRLARAEAAVERGESLLAGLSPSDFKAIQGD